MSVRALRNVLRRRLPRAFAFYKRYLRQHIVSGDPHYAIASWVNAGLVLRSRHNLADVCLDAEGAWFIDHRGLHWKFAPDIWGSTLGAATGAQHESAELDAVCEGLDASCVVVDVGANIGAFALPVTLATGARIIAVEPVLTTYTLLNDNVRRNGAERVVTTVRSALGDAIGEVVLTTDAQAANYVLSGQTKARIGEEQVPISTLDTLLADEPRIDFIKVDVEGLELNVMRGARGIVARHAPVVLLEIEQRWTSRYGYSPVDLFALMSEAGYTYERLGDSGPMPATNIAADLQSCHNFLFSPVAPHDFTAR